MKRLSSSCVFNPDGSKTITECRGDKVIVKHIKAKNKNSGKKSRIVNEEIEKIKENIKNNNSNDDRVIINVSDITNWLYCPYNLYNRLFNFKNRKEANEYNINIEEGNEFHLRKGSSFTGDSLKRAREEIFNVPYTDTLRRGLSELLIKEVENYINQIKEANNGDELVNIIVISNTLGIIGEIDKIDKLNNELILIEKKSKNLDRVYRNNELQCNSYLYCLKEFGININKYKIITPTTEFERSYDESCIRQIEEIVDNIRDMIITKQEPQTNITNCNGCGQANICKALQQNKHQDFGTWKPKTLKEIFKMKEKLKRT